MAALVSLSCGTGSTVGSIGAVLGRSPETGALHLREVPPGMAAHDAGLVPGDRIKMIDGVLVDELTTEEIKARLRGPVGSTVVLTIIRGDEVLNVELTRTPLRTPEEAPSEEEPVEE